MLRIETERPIAVVDLDGVIVENPPEALIPGAPPIRDVNYWDRHWSNPESGKLNQELLDMVQALVSTSWQVIILTARPEIFRAPTVMLLHRAGLLVGSIKPEVITYYTNRPILEMIGGDQIVSSAEWKRDTIKAWLKQGANIRLFIEDYKENAEACRDLVPVLLYERKKPTSTAAGLDFGKPDSHYVRVPTTTDDA